MSQGAGRAMELMRPQSVMMCTWLCIDLLDQQAIALQAIYRASSLTHSATRGQRSDKGSPKEV
jgi:hypothetical protein